MDLLQKLQIKPGYQIQVLNKPKGLILPTQTGKLGLAVIIFTENKKSLVNNLKDKKLLSAEYFWVAYPKGSAKVKMDLNRDILSAELKKYSMNSVRLISIDDTWSCMRFKRI